MSAPDSEGEGARKAHRAGPDAAGQRLDQWLAGVSGPDLSRSRVQALIRAGAVTVSGKAIAEPKHKLSDGDEVVVDMPAPVAAEPAGEDIALDILHEDDQLIVIDKPAGLVVHQGAGNWTGTLVNALIHHCGASLSGIGGVARPGIVHRLDKDTSGVMVAAKTDLAHRVLSEAFADHGHEGELERAYLAVVWGAPRRAGIVDAHLGRSTKDRTKQAVVPETRVDARHAITHYEVLETFGAKRPDGPIASLVECRLETGRTHQIRVHMAHIGHPLIGDRDYGGGFRTKSNPLPEPVRKVADRFPRQALHAGLLAFAHPATGEVMHFTAPIPADMAELIDAFRSL